MKRLLLIILFLWVCSLHAYGQTLTPNDPDFAGKCDNGSSPWQVSRDHPAVQPATQEALSAHCEKTFRYLSEFKFPELPFTVDGQGHVHSGTDDSDLSFWFSDIDSTAVPLVYKLAITDANGVVHTVADTVRSDGWLIVPLLRTEYPNGHLHWQLKIPEYPSFDAQGNGTLDPIKP